MLGVWLSREVYILYTHTHIYIYICTDLHQCRGIWIDWNPLHVGHHLIFPLGSFDPSGLDQLSRATREVIEEEPEILHEACRESPRSQGIPPSWPQIAQLVSLTLWGPETPWIWAWTCRRTEELPWPCGFWVHVVGLRLSGGVCLIYIYYIFKTHSYIFDLQRAPPLFMPVSCQLAEESLYDETDETSQSKHVLHCLAIWQRSPHSACYQKHTWTILRSIGIW